MTYDAIKRGSYVRALAGRDKGRINVVVRLENDEYAYIVDGLCRCTEKPKKKKLKHLALVDHAPYDGELRNKAIANAIRDLSYGEKEECKIQS